MALERTSAFFARNRWHTTGCLEPGVSKTLALPPLDTWAAGPEHEPIAVLRTCEQPGDAGLRHLLHDYQGLYRQLAS
jgi:hypothetical protein